MTWPFLAEKELLITFSPNNVYQNSRAMEINHKSSLNITVTYLFFLPLVFILAFTPTHAAGLRIIVFLLFPKAKAGFLLNIIGILCINVAINTWGTLMFQLDTFPTWINITNQTPWKERSRRAKERREGSESGAGREENVSCSRSLSSYSTGLSNTEQTVRLNPLSFVLYSFFLCTIGDFTLWRLARSLQSVFEYKIFKYKGFCSMSCTTMYMPPAICTNIFFTFGKFLTDGPGPVNSRLTKEFVNNMSVRIKQDRKLLAQRLRRKASRVSGEAHDASVPRQTNNTAVWDEGEMWRKVSQKRERIKTFQIKLSISWF